MEYQIRGALDSFITGKGFTEEKNIISSNIILQTIESQLYSYGHAAALMFTHTAFQVI